MKKINKIVFAATFMANIFLWTGCNDEFLEEKTNYDKLSPEIYNDYTGAKNRLQDLYLRLLPNANSGYSYRNPSTGTGDDLEKATEEFSELSAFVNKDVILTTSSDKLPDLFHVNKSTSAGPWGEIRNCNDVIEGVSGSTLTEAQKKELLGQAYFLRAWQYYLLVKIYGGVPIIDHLQAADVSEIQNITVPRATTKECIDFICTDLQKAADMLPLRWDAGNFGRITKGAALALAGRARLLYASPLFNRADDVARWQAAYDANRAAIDSLIAGGFKLVYSDVPGINAEGWAKMFSDYNSDEAVFVTLYNMVEDNDGANELWRNNHWENSIRPYNCYGGGGKNPTAMMVDLFPMADGKKPNESDSFTYSPLKCFLNRDPRFYRTFAFPGVRWRFDASNDPTSLGTNFPYKGDNYILWNYAWYTSPSEQADIEKSGYGADGLGDNYKGLYVRKRSNDFDLATLTPRTLYRWTLSHTRGSNKAFYDCAAPYMEIRYAEVLLNLAEAACGIGRPAEAIDILKVIRKRAGYDAAIAGEDYGLDVAALTDRGKLFAAILYERQIELAYEGKRFDDMRRWLLWDGGTKFSSIPGAPTSWTLTGFGANTCLYLGVEPLNNKRRDNIEFHTSTTSPATSAAPRGVDPIAASDRPAPLDLKSNLSDQFAALASFYDTYLVRKTRKGDEFNKVVNFEPHYYFIGLTSGAQTNNITLKQTIGWNDVTHGNSNGTFDPLAE